MEIYEKNNRHDIKTVFEPLENKLKAADSFPNSTHNFTLHLLIYKIILKYFILLKFNIANIRDYNIKFILFYAEVT